MSYATDQILAEARRDTARKRLFSCQLLDVYPRAASLYSFDRSIHDFASASTSERR
jgi:hypothetical protein